MEAVKEGRPSDKRAHTWLPLTEAIQRQRIPRLKVRYGWQSTKRVHHEFALNNYLGVGNQIVPSRNAQDSRRTSGTPWVRDLVENDPKTHANEDQAMIRVRYFDMPTGRRRGAPRVVSELPSAGPSFGRRHWSQSSGPSSPWISLPFVFGRGSLEGLFDVIYVVLAGGVAGDGLRSLEGLFEYLVGLRRLSFAHQGVRLRLEQP